jgi:hypothetical protein
LEACTFAPTLTGVVDVAMQFNKLGHVFLLEMTGTNKSLRLDLTHARVAAQQCTCNILLICEINQTNKLMMTMNSYSDCGAGRELSSKDSWIFNNPGDATGGLNTANPWNDQISSFICYATYVLFSYTRAGS